MSRSTLGEPRPWLRRSAWLTGLSAAGMVAASCSTAAPIAREARAEKPVSPSPQPVVVLHTNDNWGEVEPCG